MRSLDKVQWTIIGLSILVLAGGLWAAVSGMWQGLILTGFAILLILFIGRKIDTLNR